MMRIGSGELMVIFMIALFIFGPSRLPELGRTLGKAVGSCKYYMDSFADECKGMEEDLKQVKREVQESPMPAVRPAVQAQQEAGVQAETEEIPAAQPEPASESSEEPLGQAV